MEIQNKNFQNQNNLTIVQFETLKDEGFLFKPAAPAIEKNLLVIKEVSGSGEVSKLQALNRTRDYLFLMDNEILKGAKQNRVINTSVLIAPGKKTFIDVSCVERLRWDQTDNNFGISDKPIDIDLRSAKSQNITESSRGAANRPSVQGSVWDMISKKIRAKGANIPTENYEELLETERSSTLDKSAKFDFSPDNNAMAIFVDRELLCIDIFGNRNVYGYYFPRLREAAVRLLSDTPVKGKMGEAEAFYRLDDFFDGVNFNNLETKKVSSGTGNIRIGSLNNFTFFDLNYEDRNIHTSILKMNK